MNTPFEVLTEVYRGKYINGKLVDPLWESAHLGIAVLVDEDGQVLYSKGDIHFKGYIRSAAKPFQVLPLLESQAPSHFGFTDEELALMCASHNGEPVHVRTAASILKKIGLEEKHLGCGSHLPMHIPTAEGMLWQQERPGPLHNNCSGKHGGMLAYCVYHNLAVDHYLDFDHPLQVAIKKKIEHMLHAPVQSGTDGCSAPVFHMEVYQMAFLYAQLAARKTPALKKAFSLMHHYPYMIAGDDRFDTDLMQNSSVVAKIGAEGIECVAIPAEGSRKAMGLTVKIADGAFRALYPPVISILRQYGILSEDQLTKLKKYYPSIVTNHNKYEVGYIQSAV